MCEQRWRGRSCATELCPRGCSAPYGACVAGRCVCEPGWTGAGCENSSCPSPRGRVCAGHGACAAGHCACAEGWTAPDCSLRKESNAGCACYEYYASDECELHVCPKNCSGKGVCEAGRCQCEVGRRGVDCSLASNAQRALTADIDAPPVEQLLSGGEGAGYGEGGRRTLGGAGGQSGQGQQGLAGGAIMLGQRGSAIRRLSSREPPALLYGSRFVCRRDTLIEKGLYHSIH